MARTRQLLRVKRQPSRPDQTKAALVSGECPGELTSFGTPFEARRKRTSSGSVSGDPPADRDPRRLGASLGHGSRQAIEMINGLPGDIAVGVGRLQIAAQKV